LLSFLKEELPGLMAQANVPGLAIAIVDGERLVWAEGFGYTDRSHQVKVTLDTLFSLQSISKTYTATGFLMAVDKGWLRLDDPLRKYMPKFTAKSRFGTDEAKKITLRHLLSHWSGLPHEACAYRKSHPTFIFLNLRDLILDTIRRLSESRFRELASRLWHSSLFSFSLHAHSLRLAWN
jgi:CubicO group peptidase (beta-lactamase class C family)